jgi:hypothetical protein
MCGQMGDWATGGLELESSIGPGDFSGQTSSSSALRKSLASILSLAWSIALFASGGSSLYASSLAASIKIGKLSQR